MSATATRESDVNDPAAFDTLPAAEQQALLDWIREWLVEAERAPRVSSYFLKHVFAADDGGFYVTNGAFKGALIAAGLTLSAGSPFGTVRVVWNRPCQGYTLRNEACARRAKLGQDFCGYPIATAAGGYRRMFG